MSKTKEKPVREGVLVDQAGKALEAAPEKKELAAHKALDPAVSSDDRAMNMIAVAVDSGRPVEEIGRLIEFKERLEADAARRAYNRALALFQATCPGVPKTGRAKVNLKSGGSYEYSFPKLEVIMEYIRPHLAQNGLSVTFSDFELLDGFIALSCLIRHEDGHIERHPIKMPIDRTLSVNDMQKVGVVNSYARRYAVVNALNLTGVDPDRDGVTDRPTTKLVTEKQAILLSDWVESSGADQPKLLEFFRVDELAELPASRFSECLGMLKERQKRNEIREQEDDGGGAA